MGIVVVVAVEAGVAGRVLAMVLMVAAGQALMPTCIPILMGMALPRCKQHLDSSCLLLVQDQLRW